MAMSERARAIEERLLAEAGEVTWSTPDDLSRRAREAIAGAYLPGRQMASSGSLHLAGEGVSGSTARMSAVGDVMTTFQRLVTAIGAAQEGFKAVRGTFPAGLLAKTRLSLVASPLVGSVVLEFEPETPPAAELSPGGNVPLFDEPRTQRTDEAVGEVVDLLVRAAELGPDPDADGLLEELVERGPRVASTLREFTTVLAVADFETDLTWREPGKPTRRAVLASADAGRLASLIVSRELDHGEAIIEGVIHTVSDKTALAIATDDGSMEYVRGSKLAPQVLAAIPWGSRVRIVADTVETRRPGGETSVRYTAKRIERIADHPSGA